MTDMSKKSLAGIIAEEIKTSGPVSIERYMALCLGHETHGVYMGNNPIGAQGDFITAPEISQIFGELIGLWCTDIWQKLGEPDPFHVIELGPGHGTLMVDALRAMKRASKIVPQLGVVTKLHLVETSPLLRGIQAERLQTGGVKPHWHDTLADVPTGACAIIANEFFDALPIRQFEYRQDKWFERLIGLDEAGGFSFTLAPAPETGVKLDLPDNPPHDDALREICPTASDIIAQLGARLTNAPGAALIIDYGPVLSAYGDSFQAVRQHEFTDPFEAPGQADLTAHVDFACLAASAKDIGLNVHGPVSQGNFLKSLGIDQRAEMLAKNATEKQKTDIIAAVRRLTHPDEMGELFKVLVVTTV